MKILRFAFYAFACLVAVMLLTEVILRAHRYFSETPSERYAREYFEEVYAHIPHFAEAGTLQKNPDRPFVPPFSVFTNTDVENEDRLKRIAGIARLEPSRTWTSYDFLRAEPDENKTAYTVTSNSLGFRGPERAKEKPPGTYRIIVFGAYQAFGYGVNDDETYPAKLEAALSAAHPRVPFEVWNAGRPAGSAIDALARLSYEIFAYDPDLLILDYGQVDIGMLNDTLLFRSLGIDPFGDFARSVRSVEVRVFPLLDHSLLWKKIWAGYYANAMKRTQIEEFKDVMRRSLALAKERGVPAVVVKGASGGPPLSAYTEIVGDSPVVDVPAELTSRPPEYPKPEAWKEGEWAKTWLSELDPSQVDPNHWIFANYPYRLDLFQLNARGLEVVADILQRTIEEKFLTQ